MKALQLEKVGYVYDDGTLALRNVTFSVERGGKFAVIGPNGAGKSTLLHLIAGFRMPFSGSVTVGGLGLKEDTADEVRRRLGFLFQDPDDQIFMPTVEEDVAFGPRNLALDDVDGRVKRGLASTGISGLEKRAPHRLSYGMRKRVAIAGVMAMDPEVLLLDEPTSGLDPRSRTDLIRLLRGMDRTMLIATHDIEAAAEIVDRALVLNIEMITEGTMKELVMAHGVFDRAGLEIPPVSKLFRILESMGYPVDSLPVSMDQAEAELTKVIDRDGRHVHAHLHEHEHRDAEPGHGHVHALERRRRPEP
ncbi:MAG: energy-coupling factor ABC transporter ATP-binding protein [Thermoplasmata archaeon]